MENKYGILFLYLSLLFGEVKSDCFEYVNGIPRYTGSLSKTQSGITCQRWHTNSPHLEIYSPSTPSENYCRNPSNDQYIWCYTTNIFKRWEKCNLPECLETTTTWLVTTFSESTKLETESFDYNETSELVQNSNVTVAEGITPNILISNVQTTSPQKHYSQFINPSCTCPCVGRQNIWYNYFNGNLTEEEKNKMLNQEKERIKKALFIDSSQLSSNLRKKGCATDNRPAVMSMGSVGVGILCAMLVVIVIGDIVTCFYCKRIDKTSKKKL